MSKNYAQPYVAQQTVDFLALSDIQADDWRELIEHMHRVWGQFTAHWDGHIFDPAWETTSSSLVYASDSSSRDLDEANVGGIAERKINNDRVKVGHIIFGKDVRVDITLKEQTSASPVTLADTSYDVGSAAFASYTATLDYSNVTGATPLFLHFDYQAETTASTGKIWLARGGELETQKNSDLPTGYASTVTMSGTSDLTSNAQGDLTVS